MVKSNSDEEGCDERKEEHKAARKMRKKAKRIGKLFKYISEGLLLKVERKISKNPKLVFAEDDKGRRPLHIAASAGRFQIVMLLLRRGADVNSTDGTGNTALVIACKHRRWEIAELLLDKGASKTIANARGETALSYGLEEALADIREEDARTVEKMEWIAEERRKFADSHTGLFGHDSHEQQEREWREKLMEEHCFEYLEGGGPTRRVEASGAVFMEGWFTADEKLSDEDWWEELARQMRNRYKAFAQSTTGKQQQQQSAHSAKEDRASQDEGEAASQQRPYAGAKGAERMAWERGHGDAAAPRAAAAGPSAWHVGYKERAAAHALAWEHFISSRSGTIAYKDVPWPKVPAGGDEATEAMMLPLEQMSNPEVRRRAVREALRRWHPDKFAQRFADRLVEEERARILERVKQISQSLTALV